MNSTAIRAATVLVLVSCCWGCAGRTRSNGQPADRNAAAPTDRRQASAVSQPASMPTASIVEELKNEARRLRPLFKTALVQAFLNEVQTLPAVPPRTIYRTEDKKTYYTAAEYEKLSATDQDALDKLPLRESFYYLTKYGSPLAYCRALELLSEAGFEGPRGKRILDFGYGTAGHLRLLAGMGADVVGVDVDPILPVLYGEPGDQGALRGTSASGTLKLVDGQWPANEAVKAAVGGGFDLIMSKNTLKNGYVNPAPSVDPRMTVQLGVKNAEYVQAVCAALKPGGFFMIYNICPAPAKPGQPVIPWADGRCPFSQERLAKAGFEVLKFDETDDEAAKEMAHALGWDQGPGAMDLENDFFTWCTIARKPAR